MKHNIYDFHKISLVQTLQRKTTSVNLKMILKVCRKPTSKKIEELLWLQANQFIYTSCDIHMYVQAMLT